MQEFPLPPAEKISTEAEEFRDKGRALLGYLTKFEKHPPVKWLALAAGHRTASGLYKRLDDKEEGSPGIEDFYAAARSSPENRGKIIDFLAEAFGFEWQEPSAGHVKEECRDTRANKVIQLAAELIATIAAARADKHWSSGEMTDVINAIAKLDHVAKPLRADLDTNVEEMPWRAREA